MNLIPIFLDFSHIYEQQVQLDGIAHVMIDCSDIPGTNGYCDEAAAIEIRQRLERHISAQKKNPAEIWTKTAPVSYLPTTEITIT